MENCVSRAKHIAVRHVMLRGSGEGNVKLSLGVTTGTSFRLDEGSVSYGN
jgi:hypothetical protein